FRIDDATAYIEEFSEFQRPRTLPPTELITAIAATTIKPAISAYSSTSPPCSSRTSFRTKDLKDFMTVSVNGSWQWFCPGTVPNPCSRSGTQELPTSG